MAETKSRALLWKVLQYLRHPEIQDCISTKELRLELEAHLEPHKKKP